MSLIYRIMSALTRLWKCTVVFLSGVRCMQYMSLPPCSPTVSPPTDFPSSAPILSSAPVLHSPIFYSPQNSKYPSEDLVLCPCSISVIQEMSNVTDNRSAAMLENCMRQNVLQPSPKTSDFFVLADSLVGVWVLSCTVHDKCDALYCIV